MYSANSEGEKYNEKGNTLALPTGLDTLQDGGDVVFGVLEVLNAHNALENNLLLRIARVVHDARAIDEVNPPHQRNVLPHLRFP